MLTDRSRRRILDLLRERERSVNELVDDLGLSQPGVSKHLRILREAGLVRVLEHAEALLSGQSTPDRLIDAYCMVLESLADFLFDTPDAASRAASP